VLHAYLAYVPGPNICLFLRFLRYVVMIDTSMSYTSKYSEGASKLKRRLVRDEIERGCSFSRISSLTSSHFKATNPIY
jgi:hypothetical protein